MFRFRMLVSLYLKFLMKILYEIDIEHHVAHAHTQNELTLLNI